MGFTATSGGGNFKQVPAGNYVARCYQLIDLGHQLSEKFGTSAHKIRIGWEIFGEDDEGQPLTIVRDGVSMPMTVAAEYTVSLNEKANLRKVLAAWRGRDFSAEELKGFDISKLLGQYCLLNVTTSTSSNGKTYSNVGSIAPLPKAMAASKPAGVHQLQRFDLDDPDMEVFEDLPNFLKEKIESSPEWEKSQRPATATAAAGIDDDDVPF
jgi:hypothetical protein